MERSLYLMKCEKCDYQLEEGDKFCSKCGQEVKKQNKNCNKCDNKLDIGVKFCPNCGVAVDNEEKQPTLSKVERKDFKGKVAVISVAILFVLGVSIYYIINQSSSPKVTEGNEIEEMNQQKQEEEFLIDRFPFYEELAAKDEIQQLVDTFYEENSEPFHNDLVKKIEQEYGSRSSLMFENGLFIEEEMSLEDKEQILLHLRDETEGMSAKIITNPIDYPDNRIEEENRYRSLSEMEIIDDRYTGEDELIVDTEGFIAANDGGLNLGYPIIDTHFYDGQNYMREIEFAIHHYVEEDIPLNATALTQHYEKLLDKFNVQINGNDIREYLYDDIDEEVLENMEEYLEEQIEYRTEDDGYNENYYLLKNSILTIHIYLPLDVLVDVPARQFPIDGEIHELFSHEIENENIIISINGEDYPIQLAGDDIFTTSINPEVIESN